MTPGAKGDDDRISAQASGSQAMRDPAWPARQVRGQDCWLRPAMGIFRGWTSAFFPSVSTLPAREMSRSLSLTPGWSAVKT
jgi:hypothetical protein